MTHVRFIIFIVFCSLLLGRALSSGSIIFDCLLKFSIFECTKKVLSLYFNNIK